MVGELVTLPLRVGVSATRLWVRGAGQAVAVAASATEQLIDAVVGRTSVRGTDPHHLRRPAQVWPPIEVSPPERRIYGEPPREAGPYREPPPEAGPYREPVPQAGPREPEPPAPHREPEPPAPPRNPEPRPPHLEPEPPRPPEARSPPPPLDPPGPTVTSNVPGGPAHVSEERTLVQEFAELGAEDGAGAELHVQEPWRGYREMNAKQVIARLVEAGPAELAAVQLYESRHRSRQKILTAVGRQLQKANGRGQR
jgi:hypothetical protein